MVRPRINTFKIQGMFVPKTLVKSGNQPDYIAFEYLIRVAIDNNMQADEIHRALTEPVIEALRKDHPNHIIGTQNVTFSTYFLIDTYQERETDFPDSGFHNFLAWININEEKPATDKPVILFNSLKGHAWYVLKYAESYATMEVTHWIYGPTY